MTRDVRPLALAGIMLFAWLPLAADALGIEGGMPVREALERLHEQGLRIVWATHLVRADLRVVAAPRADSTLIDQAREVLAPHSLTIDAGDVDAWVVVRTAPSKHEVGEVAPKVEVPLVEEVMVTASHYRFERAAATSRIKLAVDDLESTASIANDTMRMLQNIPGFASLGLSAAHRIRGGDTNEVLYLFDGVEVVQPFHLRELQSPFGVIHERAVDEIETYTGGFPTRYGGRLSGVVDMRPALPPAEPTYEVDLNLFSVSALTHGRGASGFEWLATARRGTLDQVLRLVDKNLGRPLYHDELVRVRFEPRIGTVTLGFMNFDDELAADSERSKEITDSKSANKYGWLAWQRPWTDRVSSKTLLAVTSIKDRRRGSLNEVFDAVADLSEDREFLISRMAQLWNVDLAGAAFEAGWDVVAQDGRFDVASLISYGPLGEPLGNTQASSLDVRVDRNGIFASAYVSARADLGPRLHGEVGVRYDLQDADPYHREYWSPRLALRVSATPALSLFVNVGRFVQHQSLYELQINDGLIELQRPQRSNQFILGARWSARTWSLRAEMYVKNIKSPFVRFENAFNRWVLIPEVHGDRIAILPDTSRARGIELIVAGHVSERLAWRFGYSYSQIVDRVSGWDVDRPWDQRHAFFGQARYEHDQWSIQVNGVYHTGWPVTTRRPVITPSDLFDVDLDDFFSLDLRVARHFKFRGVSAVVYLAATNLSSRSNIGGVDFDAAEDGTVTRQARQLLPLVPTVGVEVRF